LLPEQTPTEKEILNFPVQRNRETLSPWWFRKMDGFRYVWYFDYSVSGHQPLLAGAKCPIQLRHNNGFHGGFH
jgi:hypothetical protein